jgi:NAD-dependent SIR2 family protein deacetylase
MKGITKEEFIREYSKSVSNANAALFIGAGISREAGYKDWSEMLEQVASDIGLSVANEKHDLITLAQYYVNSRDRSRINREISRLFSEEKEPTENHKILTSLPITSY